MVQKLFSKLIVRLFNLVIRIGFVSLSLSKIKLVKP